MLEKFVKLATALDNLGLIKKTKFINKISADLFDLLRKQREQEKKISPEKDLGLLMQKVEKKEEILPKKELGEDLNELIDWSSADHEISRILDEIDNPDNKKTQTILRDWVNSFKRDPIAREKDRPILFFFGRLLRKLVAEWKRDRDSADSRDPSAMWMRDLRSLLEKEANNLKRISLVHSSKPGTPHPQFLKLLGKMKELIALPTTEVWPEAARYKIVPHRIRSFMRSMMIKCLS